MTAPSTPPTARPEDIDALLDQIGVPKEVRAAGAALLLEAAFVGLFAVQNLAFVRWYGWYGYVPIALLVPVVASAVAGVGLVRARAWSLRAALAAGGVLLAADAAWVVLLYDGGIVSPLGIATVAGGLLAFLFVLSAARPFARVASVRRRLRQAGYDVDL